MRTACDVFVQELAFGGVFPTPLAHFRRHWPIVISASARPASAGWQKRTWVPLEHAAIARPTHDGPQICLGRGVPARDVAPTVAWGPPVCPSLPQSAPVCPSPPQSAQSPTGYLNEDADGPASETS